MQYYSPESADKFNAEKLYKLSLDDWLVCKIDELQWLLNHTVCAKPDSPTGCQQWYH